MRQLAKHISRAGRGRRARRRRGPRSGWAAGGDCARLERVKAHMVGATTAGTQVGPYPSPTQRAAAARAWNRFRRTVAGVLTAGSSSTA